MKIIDSILRAVVERVTELEVVLYGERKVLYVFENLDKRGVPCKFWVQDWECDDITDTLPTDFVTYLQDSLKEHYKSAATTKN